MKKNVFIFIYFLTISLSVFAQSEEDRAIKLYEQKSFKDSQLIFQKILKEDPENERAQEYLGSICFDLMEYQKSASYVKPLVEKHPNIARFHFKYAGAIGMYAKNNKMKGVFLIDDIKKHFHKAVDLDAKFVDARLALVHLYMELPGVLGGSKEKALFYAKEVQLLDKQAGVEAMQLITAAN